MNQNSLFTLTVLSFLLPVREEIKRRRTFAFLSVAPHPNPLPKGKREKSEAGSELIFLQRKSPAAFCRRALFMLHPSFPQNSLLFTQEKGQIVEFEGIGLWTVSNGNGTGFALHATGLGYPDRPYQNILPDYPGVGSKTWLYPFPKW